MRKLVVFFTGVMLLMVQHSYSQQRVSWLEDFDDAQNLSFTAAPPNFWMADAAYSLPNASGVSVQSYLGLVPSKAGDSTILELTGNYNCTGFPYVFLRFSHICKIAPSDSARIEFRELINGVPGPWQVLPAASYLGGAETYNSSSRFVFNSSSYSSLWQPSNLAALPSSSWWQEELFDLENQVGGAVFQLRFVIRRGNGSGTHASYGWLLENIEVMASSHRLDPPSVRFIPPSASDTVFSTGPWEISIEANPNASTKAPLVVPFYFKWTTNSGVQDSVQLTGTGPLWKVTIPQYPAGTTVNYTVTVIDTNSNYATANSWYYIKQSCGGSGLSPVNNYSYTGSVQQVLLSPGIYKLETWGADGGNSSASPIEIGGTGGYSTGTLTVTSNTTLYIYVGGAGVTRTSNALTPGGYNGGGDSPAASGGMGGSGGGATHIATVSGLLSSLPAGNSSIKIVAGGGGGAAYDLCGTAGSITGGHGGGMTGGTGQNFSAPSRIGVGGTQSAGGAGGTGGSGGAGNGQNGSFGQGGNGGFGTYPAAGGGGGGGYYGGGGGSDGSSCAAAGGGGSGYIGGVTGGTTAQLTEPGFVANPVTNGNGYARITVIQTFGSCLDNSAATHSIDIDDTIAANPMLNTPIVVTVKNKGTTNLDSVKVFYSVNGGLPDSTVWHFNPSLLWDYNYTDTVGYYQATADGFDSITVWVKMPNGQYDSTTYDDTLTKKIYGTSDLHIELVEIPEDTVYNTGTFEVRAVITSLTNYPITTVPLYLDYIEYQIPNTGRDTLYMTNQGGNIWSVDIYHIRYESDVWYTIELTDMLGNVVTAADSFYIKTPDCLGSIDESVSVHQYTGTVQSVDLTPGTYILETWGANGGVGSSSIAGGQGGYSKIELNVASTTTYYIVVGGVGGDGSAGDNIGGYNGGGNGGPPSWTGGGGGGATHISTSNNGTGLLNNATVRSNTVVAAGGGGGGGGFSPAGIGGNGGGTSGANGNYTGTGNATGGSGGTSSSGGTAGIGDYNGTAGQAGLGGDGGGTTTGDKGGGGGGGWYGGGGGAASSSSSGASGGGGSGYIGTLPTITNGITAQVIQPNFVVKPVITGHGYAIITAVSGSIIGGNPPNVDLGSLVPIKGGTVNNNMRLPTTGDNSYTVTSGIVYPDLGGPTSGTTTGYSNSCLGSSVIYPEKKGALIQVSGTYQTESVSYDWIEIYDGIGTGGTMLGQRYGGTGTIPPLTSTTGPLTVHFRSDGSVNTYPGFALDVVSLGVGEAKSRLCLDNSVALEEIITPTEQGNVGVITPVLVRIRNKGENPLYYCEIDWTLNGVPQPPTYYYNNLAGLPEDFTDTMTIGYCPAAAMGSADQIVVWVSMPNSTLDSVTYDDTLEVVSVGCGQFSTINVGAGSSVATIGQALDILNQCSVSSDVTLFLRGTFNENVNLSNLDFMNGYHLTITSSGNHPDSAVIHPASGAGIQFGNAKNLTLKAITVDVSSLTVPAVQFTAACTNILIRDCKLLGNPISNNITDANTPLYKGSGTGRCDSIFIINNLIDGGNYGIYITEAGGSTTGYGTNFYVDSNIISNQYECAARFYYVDCKSFSYNQLLSRITDISDTWRTLWINYCNADKMVGNRIIQRTAAIDFPEGIMAYYLNYYQNNNIRAFIANNEIVLSSTGDVNDGIFGSYANADIYHNSIYLNGDNNNGINQSYSDFDIKNNNIAMTGTYSYPIYKDAGGAIASNYNNLYAPTYVGYVNGAITSISAWQAAVPGDLNSVSMQPSFIDQSSGVKANLKMTNAAGLSCPNIGAIPQDIEGTPRTPTTTMGCYEMVNISLDAALVALLTTNPAAVAGQTDTVKVRLVNAGTSAVINSVSLAWTVNNGSPVPLSPYSFVLTPGQTMELTVGILPYTVPVADVKVWITGVNGGGLDSYQGDDTVSKTINVLSDIVAEFVTNPTDTVYRTGPYEVTAKIQFLTNPPPASVPLYIEYIEHEGSNTSIYDTLQLLPQGNDLWTTNIYNIAYESDVRYRIELIDLFNNHIVLADTYYIKRPDCEGSVNSDPVSVHEYTGAVQSVNLTPGTYTLETWGADGNIRSGSTAIAGVGGYSKGTFTVASNTTIYIYVGGQPLTQGWQVTGYNGGGAAGATSNYGGGGGGATHIATATGVLSSLSSNQSAVLIVAGGGGGGGYNSPSNGGNGGGTTGQDGAVIPIGGGGGTQSAGGVGGVGTTNGLPGSFGQGGGTGVSGSGNGGGGGGGFYGGGNGAGSGSDGGGGGGSGYIGGVTGGITVQATDPSFIAKPVITGHGYAKITAVSGSIIGGNPPGSNGGLDLNSFVPLKGGTVNNNMRLPITGSNSYTVSSGIVYPDLGGPTSGTTTGYSNNCLGSSVIYPEKQGALIQVSGTFQTESVSYDWIEIYDGVGTTGTMLGQRYGGTGTIPPLTSTTGPLTVHFRSDGSVNTFPGFALNVISLVSNGSKSRLCLDNSVAMDEIISPREEEYAGVSTPVLVRIRNKGELKLDSCYIDWTLDGNLQTQVLYTHPTGLLPDFTDTMTIGTCPSVAGGQYEVIAWVSLPNGEVDSVTYDDTLSVLYKAVPLAEFVAPFVADTLTNQLSFEVHARIFEGTGALIVQPQPQLHVETYLKGNQAYNQNINMTFHDGIWTAAVPPQFYNSKVYYSLTVSDLTGNTIMIMDSAYIKLNLAGSGSGGGLVDSIIIGTNTYQYYQVPINTYYGNNWSRQVYLYREVCPNLDPLGTIITGMAWHYIHASTPLLHNNQTCFMRVITDSVETNVFIDPLLTGGQQVWSGTLTSPAPGWTDITLDTAFYLPAGMNLEVFWYNAHGTYYTSNNPTWANTYMPYNMTAHSYSDSYLPIPPNTATIYANTNRPDIKLVKQAPLELYPNNDLAVLEVLSPVNNPNALCELLSSPVKVLMANLGETDYDFTRDNIALHYEITDPLQGMLSGSTLINTGELLSGKSDTFELISSLPLVAGTYNLTLWVESASDMIPYDDTVFSVYTSGKIGMPLDEDFSGAVISDDFLSLAFLGNGQWEAYVPDSNDAAQPDFGTGVARYIGGSAAMAQLITHQLDIYGTINPKLEFWYYHDSTTPSSNNSKLIVNVITENDTVKELEILKRDTFSGWQKYEVDLTNYTTAQCVLVQFVAMSGLGTGDFSQYLDRIYIYAAQNLAVDTILVPGLAVCDFANKEVQVVMYNNSLQRIYYNRNETGVSVEVYKGATLLNSGTILFNTGFMEPYQRDTLTFFTMNFDTGTYNLVAWITEPIDQIPVDDTARKILPINPDIEITAIPNTSPSNCIAKEVEVSQRVTITNKGNFEVPNIPLEAVISDGSGQPFKTLNDVLPGLQIGESRNFPFSESYFTPADNYYNVAVTATLACDANQLNNRSLLTECVDLDDIEVVEILTPSGTQSDTAGNPVYVKVKIKNNSLTSAFRNFTIRASVSDGTANPIVVTDTIAQLNAGSEMDYLFKKPYLVPDIQTYAIDVFVDRIDLYPFNDTAQATRSVYGVGTIDYQTNRFSLGQNIPNPAKNNTRIEYSLPEDGQVVFTVYTITGQALYIEQKDAFSGKNDIEFNTVHLASGVYFYSMEYKGEKLVKRMNIVK